MDRILVTGANGFVGRQLCRSLSQQGFLVTAAVRQTAIAPAEEKLSRTLDAVHHWYVLAGVLLLFAGIITGSMWAASSWGRYWGWDPKEVWSLVALLAYLAVLHVRVSPRTVPRYAYAVAALLGVGVMALLLQHFAPLGGRKLALFGGIAVAMLLFVLARGRFSTAVKSIVAFWTILMTYVGVNYVLGTGLHSYAFGKGAVAGRMMQIGAADLLVVLLCAACYLVRRPRVNEAVERAGE